ncbi:cyanophycinase [Aridibaculum aurantiacum]|uniref:cyanophycinase n=1 Tax=Aridibaculum aurantiacum TaxID=2810307 RepID=UPI001A960837|nr:cyanophycinase [Aridibaculum aurantiacum]
MAKNVKQIENPCPVPKGTLLIIGGRENKGQEVKRPEETEKEHRMEILETFVKLVNKKDPVIEVVTTPTSLPEESFSEYKEAFTKLGVKKVGQIHHTVRQQVLDEDLTERIDKADAFFITGGDQLLLTSIYGGTSFLTQLKEKYINSDFVVGGTSAGAMALSTPMIYAGNKEIQQIAGEIKITTGLEFLKDVCIDTHFVDRSRFVRIAQVIATNPTSIGIGIDEDTAIIVRAGAHVEVIGSGLITIIDGFNIKSTNIADFSPTTPIAIRDIRVHLLCAGEKFEIPLTNPPHK